MRSGVLLGIMSALEKTLVLDKGACLLAPRRVRNKVKVGAKKRRKLKRLKSNILIDREKLL